MKALELKVFPPIPECPQPHWGSFAYVDWFTDRSAEIKLRERKRLTDTELAAEMHAANSDAWRAHSAKGTSLPLLEDRFETLARFATLPHYDEVTA